MDASALYVFAFAVSCCSDCTDGNSLVAYGAEILPYHMRLKGLSIMLSVQSVAQAFVSPDAAFMTPDCSIDEKLIALPP